MFSPSKRLNVRIQNLREMWRIHLVSWSLVFFLDTLNTVRIRVKTNKLCYEDDKLWSNWSQEMSIGKKRNSTLYITMLLIVPVIVAGAIIVLLLYLKRLKIIIFLQFLILARFLKKCLETRMMILCTGRSMTSMRSKPRRKPTL